MIIVLVCNKEIQSSDGIEETKKGQMNTEHFLPNTKKTASRKKQTLSLSIDMCVCVCVYIIFCWPNERKK